MSLQQASRNRHFLLGERSDATRTLQASGPSDRLTEEMTRLEEQVLTEGLGKLRFLHNIAGLYITQGSGIAVNTLLTLVLVLQIQTCNKLQDILLHAITGEVLEHCGHCARP